MHIADSAVGVGHFIIQAVGIAVRVNVFGVGQSGVFLKSRYGIVDVLAVFAKVLKGKDIARFGKITGFVGNPYFNFIDVNGGERDGSIPQPFVVVIAKILGQEKVPVGVVTGCRYVESRNLRTSLGFHGLGFALALRKQGGQRQTAKLHVGFHPKQVGSPGD